MDLDVAKKVFEDNVSQLLTFLKLGDWNITFDLESGGHANEEHDTDWYGHCFRCATHRSARITLFFETLRDYNHALETLIHEMCHLLTADVSWYTYKKTDDDEVFEFFEETLVSKLTTILYESYTTIYPTIDDE